ncbi:MAG: DUF4445 domain-containing protein [Verrucomicrobiae bacterium]|nr:DUF4445 domain-containing protein [Verrucomicrobiae bacterium]
MSENVKIELLPLGKTLEVERGTPLQDLLFAHGVEFPCGGRGRCKGCKVKVLVGTLPITDEDRKKLTSTELADGWRLACRSRAEGDLQLELAQWEATILTDDTVFDFTPQDGLGVAIDLGTTTIVAQLLDLRTGHVLAVRTALNRQAQHGADIMSRVEFAVAGGGQAQLKRLIREQVGELVQELLGVNAASGRVRHSVRAAIPQADNGARGVTRPTSAADLKHIVLVGNTVMHHLFCGVSVEPLSHYPFAPMDDGLRVLTADDLGWKVDATVSVRFLPCLGGFVGSDILAGVLAIKLHEREALVALVDLGTNGEIVVGNRERMLCASTAAGPAFEGARIWMGMRAVTGAISEVHIADGGLHCHVLGNAAPRGICGSGLVDTVAGALELGWVKPNGRLANGSDFTLAGPVKVSQTDIRELQLAKGAIAAGLEVLLRQWGATKADLTRVYLAGAFGNYINLTSARRIGLLDFPADNIQPAGNTALLGAKLALFGLREHDADYPDLRRKISHVSLHEDPHFQKTYVEQMTFP